MCVVPYTLGLMAPTNVALMEHANAGDAMKNLDQGDVTEVGMSKAQGLKSHLTEELLNRWAVLNYGRAAIPGVGTVVLLRLCFNESEAAWLLPYGISA